MKKVILQEIVAYAAGGVTARTEGVEEYGIDPDVVAEIRPGADFYDGGEPLATSVIVLRNIDGALDGSIKRRVLGGVEEIVESLNSVYP